MAFSPNQTLKHVFTDQFPCFVCIFARCKLMLSSKLHEVFADFVLIFMFTVFLSQSRTKRALTYSNERIVRNHFFSHIEFFFTRFALRAHVKRTFSLSIAARKWLITRDLCVFAIIEFVDAFTPCIMVAILLS